MGFVGKYIQTCACNGAVLQGCNQGLFIDHAATSHVDQKAAWSECLQDFGVDQVLGACTAGGDGHQKIHMRGQFRSRGVELVSGIGFGRACRVGDRHAESTGPLGDGFANAAQAHDAQASPRDFAAQGHGAAGPLACTDKLVCLRDSATHRQHQAHGQIGHIVGQHIGGVSDRDAMFDGGRYIHTVIAHAKHRDHFGIGQLREQAARYAGLTRSGHTQDAGGEGCKSGRVCHMRAVVHGVLRFQGFLVEGVQFGNSQHIGFGHVGFSSQKTCLDSAVQEIQKNEAKDVASKVVV